MNQSYTREKSSYTGVLIVLAALFFMWGLITVLNFMLVDQLKVVFAMTPAQALLVNFIFFATYFVAAIPAGKIINRYGFKNGIISGLVVAGFGFMLFYPASEAVSYDLFIFSLFLVAAGITMLQVGANAYVVMLGKKERGASRLTLVQAFNSLGAFLAPLFASGLFMSIAGFTEASRANMSTHELIDATIKYVQLPYLGLGAILFLLALFVGFSKLPKLVTETAEPLPKSENGAKKFIIQFPHVILAGLAIFAYVGAEVTIGRYLAGVASTGMIAGSVVALYWGLALLGRFGGAALLQKISPRKLVGINALIAAFLVLVFIFIPKGDVIAFYILAAVGLFNSIQFPSIFALGIDGLGKFTEEGSSVLIMSVVGGAIIPMVWGDLYDASLTGAFVLIILCYIYISYFGFKGSRYEKRTNFY